MYQGIARGVADTHVDFRSDTVTRPTPAMRAAMAAAVVGDDVYGEDPTVIALERATAERMGKAAGLFLPSGTQSNLCAMLAHCGRGEEVISGDAYHVYRYEARGAGVLGGVALTPLPLEAHGGVALDALREAIKPDDPHFPVSRLLSLENTVSGRVVPVSHLESCADIARAEGLAVHLDGARIFNAAVALNVTPDAVAAPADSVSVCLSKGLGAPVGSVLCADEALIERARRLRKMLGGGMRQAGILAAAGLYALDHHVDRLAEDHARAARLRSQLSAIDGVVVDQEGAPTNMVFMRLAAPERSPAFLAHLRDHGVVTGGPSPWMRLVLHLDIDDEGVERLVNAARAFFAA